MPLPQDVLLDGLLRRYRRQEHRVRRAPADLRERRRREETADALRVLTGRPTTADAVAHVLRDAGTGHLGGPRNGAATEM
ncbi:DUF5133 domain-containing protein [Streptomyces sp. NPDC088674]|uniref:DUF5133 domain-containing protein n=1 Tax=Streptomyces sp. NPDC088674 TaxID=3365869 RepID=UPI0037F9CA61